MSTIDQPGSFCLGRRYDLANGQPQPEPLLYDSQDLTTHAVCVGMTGSGKTGLCLSLLEEAALDGIPVIAIDPKGDLGNLLLAFPQLAPRDFRPWIEPNDAARQRMTPDEFAVSQTQLWRNGLAKWGQGPERIRRFVDADQLKLEPLVLKPRKADIEIDGVTLVWLPFRVESEGVAEPVYQTTTSEVGGGVQQPVSIAPK